MKDAPGGGMDTVLLNTGELRGFHQSLTIRRATIGDYVLLRVARDDVAEGYDPNNVPDMLLGFAQDDSASFITAGVFTVAVVEDLGEDGYILEGFMTQVYRHGLAFPRPHDKLLFNADIDPSSLHQSFHNLMGGTQ